MGLWFNSMTWYHLIKQNECLKYSNGPWVTLGWNYEFPNIEGSQHYIVIPFNNKGWLWDSPDFYFIESTGQFINYTNSKTTGSSIFESMDIRLLKNGSYHIDQHWIDIVAIYRYYKTKYSRYENSSLPLYSWEKRNRDYETTLTWKICQF